MHEKLGGGRSRQKWEQQGRHGKNLRRQQWKGSNGNLWSQPYVPPRRDEDYIYIYYCSRSKQFWSEFELYWCLISKQRICLCLENVLYGILTENACPLLQLLNYFIIIGKLYLWDYSSKQIPPNIYGFRTKIIAKYETEENISNKEFFKRKWILTPCSAYEVKNNNSLFERPFKVKKNGVFLFGISFFVLEIFTFLYYANEGIDDVIDRSTKTIKYWI